MTLSNLQQNFTVWWGPNFFYPEVTDRWLPVIRRQMYPWLSVSDYMLAQIQSFSLPAVNMKNVTQQGGRYQLTKRSGNTLDEAMDKSLTITFKLTEGYTSYFIMRQQLDLYYQIIKTKPLYMSPINIDLLDDSGHAIITYEQEQVTPIGMSELQLSYASKLGSYTTFTLECKYNYFSIWYLDSVSKKMIREDRLS